MDLLDLIIVVVVVGAAVGGYRIGFIGRAVSWLGLAAGFYAAVRLLPTVVADLHRASPGTLVAIAVVMLVGGAMVGQAVGLLAGARLHSFLPLGPVRLLDRAVGAVVGAAGVLAVLWLLIPSLASVPGWSARSVTDSAIARALSRELPRPPSTLDVLRRIVGSNNPQVFSVLQPGLASGPPPASSPLSPSLSQSVLDSTVEVQGQACGEIYEGSGFAVAPDLIVTNAHVVAGEKPGQTSVIKPSGQPLPAAVVMFDPDRDLALLSVPSLGEQPLALAAPVVGQVGAVFGHPGGQSQVAVSPAQVVKDEQAVGPNIYGGHQTKRDVLVLAAALEHGDSGGPLVDTSGQVVGVAFAIAADRSSTAYALSTTEVRAALAEPRRPHASTQGCLTSG